MSEKLGVCAECHEYAFVVEFQRCANPECRISLSIARLKLERDEAVALYDKLEADERGTLAHVRLALLDGLRARDATLVLLGRVSAHPDLESRDIKELIDAFLDRAKVGE